MDAERIKRATNIKLKPSDYLVDPEAAYHYQCKMILLMLTHQRYINWDDVGLGKTVESVFTMAYLKAANPTTKFLVLTEKIAYTQWMEELEKYTTLKGRIITTQEIPDPVQRIKAFRQHGVDVVITGYGQVYNYLKYMREGLLPRWALFADEPNVFKNTDTQLHKRMNEMVNDPVNGASRAFGLTATIIENRLEEAFGIFRIICPGTFDSNIEFFNRYCIRKTIRGGRKIVVGHKNLGHFRARIAKTSYGRLQDDPDVEQELPDLMVKDVQVTMTEKQSRKVLEAMDRIIEMPGGEVKAVMMLPSLILAQQLVNDPTLKGFELPAAKIEALTEMLEGSLRGQRVVIFSKLRSMIDSLEAHFKKRGLEIVRITGAEKDDQRELSKKRFMDDNDSVHTLLINRAGAKSANLQKGGHLFFFDVPWSYGIYRQIIGRLKRTGSIHKIIGVYHLLAKMHPKVALETGSYETIDHYALGVVRKKFELWKGVTGDKVEIISSTSELTEIWEAVRQRRKVA